MTGPPDQIISPSIRWMPGGATNEMIVSLVVTVLPGPTTPVSWDSSSVQAVGGAGPSSRSVATTLTVTVSARPPGSVAVKVKRVAPSWFAVQANRPVDASTLAPSAVSISAYAGAVSSGSRAVTRKLTGSPTNAARSLCGSNSGAVFWPGTRSTTVIATCSVSAAAIGNAPSLARNRTT